MRCSLARCVVFFVLLSSANVLFLIWRINDQSSSTTMYRVKLRQQGDAAAAHSSFESAGVNSEEKLHDQLSAPSNAIESTAAPPTLHDDERKPTGQASAKEKLQQPAAPTSVWNEDAHAFVDFV